jgi:hypothetical protein
MATVRQVQLYQFKAPNFGKLWMTLDAKEQQRLSEATVKKINLDQPGRVLNGFPINALVDAATLKILHDKISHIFSIMEIQPRKDSKGRVIEGGYEVVVGKKRFQNWFENVFHLAEQILLDGRGNLKSHVIQLLGWENFKCIHDPRFVAAVLSSFSEALWEHFFETILMKVGMHPGGLAAIGKLHGEFIPVMEATLSKIVKHQGNFLANAQDAKDTNDDVIQNRLKKYLLTSLVREFEATATFTRLPGEERLMSDLYLDVYKAKHASTLMRNIWCSCIYEHKIPKSVLGALVRKYLMMAEFVEDTLNIGLPKSRVSMFSPSLNRKGSDTFVYSKLLENKKNVMVKVDSGSSLSSTDEMSLSSRSAESKSPSDKRPGSAASLSLDSSQESVADVEWGGEQVSWQQFKPLRVSPETTIQLSHEVKEAKLRA